MTNTKSNRNQVFILYNKIKDFNKYVRINIANSISSIYRDIRIHLLDECYNLSSLFFESDWLLNK